MSSFETKSASLFYNEGSSDKIYKCEIAPNAGAWDVKFAYGRRGSAMTTGTKNTKPVSYAEAVKIFDKLVAEKTAKGYRHDGAAVSIQVGTKFDTGIRPMLLNEVFDEHQLDLLLDDPLFDCWDMQEKFDGRRLCIQLEGDRAVACNRKGQQVPADIYIRDMRQMQLPDGIYDGEDMGNRFVIFDFSKKVPPAEQLQTKTWEQRDADMIAAIGNREGFESIRFAYTYNQAKREVFEEIKARRGEGVVFRKRNGVYRAGRPASGGDILKWKFKADITCSVLKINDKRSVQLGLQKKDLITGLPVFEFVGNVTIPANHDIPSVGDAVDINYLYAYAGGSLYQPVYKGKRDDVPVDGFDKLKIKAEEEDEE